MTFAFLDKLEIAADIIIDIKTGADECIGTLQRLSNECKRQLTVMDKQ